MSDVQHCLSGLKVPVFGAPMFIVSYPELVIAQCNAGVVGCFPSLNARSPDQLRDWIVQIKAALTADAAPFSVNLVALDSNKRYMADLAICVEEKVPIVITSMRAPHDVVEAVHGYGGLHFHDVINRRHAEKAIESGVDGLILVCTGAGGHAGMLHPYAFVQEIRSFYSGTVILSGSITSGAEVFASRLLGVDYCYIGTRFIATHEANADDAYKRMITHAGVDDIVYTPEFTGVNANFLKESIQHSGIDPNSLSGPLYRKPNKLLLWWKHFKLRHSKQWKELWSAGQSVAGTGDIISVSEYVSRLERDYTATKALAASL